MEASNVKVMVRMRLFNKREIKISEDKKQDLRPCVKMRGNTCAIVEFNTDSRDFVREREREAFDFDECFWSMPRSQYAYTEKEFATQVYVYQRSGWLALKAALEGFHVCIFAYGQTGSGKTYSMLGTPEDPGISPRLVDDLFRHIAKNTNPALRLTVECMFYEIYNEKVRDLFNKKSKQGDYSNPRIRSDAKKGVYVEGLQRKECADADFTKQLIEKGTLERAVAETKMNSTSSRSHAIFQIIITQFDGLKGTKKMSYVNLVDLAGSERISLSQVTGASLVEATNINKSLSTLRRVIDVLIENSTNKKQQVPPFRESVLTYVLSDSLGGNSKTQMIATISPHEANMEDTIGTLRYALRARSIVCEARVNEEESAAMLQSMRDEIMRLRQAARDGLLPEGSGVMMPEDIQREIAEKEAEMAKMEEEQSKMESLMEQLKDKMKEMDLAKQELAVAVTEQKRERFAAAFRNAFVISTDKKRIEQHVASLNELTDENMQLKRRVALLTSEVGERTQMHHALVKENGQLADGLQRVRSELDTTVAKLDQQTRNLDEMKSAFERQLTTSEERIAELTGEAERYKKRIESMTADLTGLTHAAERETMEKNRVRNSFEEAVMAHMREVEELRKKKDAYKLAVAEEKQRVLALRKGMTSHDEERQSLLETIRALQTLIKEKDFLVSTAHAQCDDAVLRADDARKKLAERDETIRALLVALKEYQEASHSWMSDLSTRDREIARLTALATDPNSKVNADLQMLRDHMQLQLSTPQRDARYPAQGRGLPSSAHRAMSPRSPISARRVDPADRSLRRTASPRN